MQRDRPPEISGAAGRSRRPRRRAVGRAGDSLRRRLADGCARLSALRACVPPGPPPRRCITTWNASSAARLSASQVSPAGDRPDRAAVDEAGRVAALVRLRRVALEPHLEPQQRQRHAAAAAELAALDPGRQPAATEHRLVLDSAGLRPSRGARLKPSIHCRLPRVPTQSPIRLAISPLRCTWATTSASSAPRAPTGRGGRHRTAAPGSAPSRITCRRGAASGGADGA